MDYKDIVEDECLEKEIEISLVIIIRVAIGFKLEIS